MNSKKLYYGLGAFVFLFALFVGFSTVQPSVSFWDCGEFIASSYGMQVPHPPGTPFFLILGRLFSLIPFAANIGFRVNTISVLTSGFTILFLYLIAVKLIRNYRKDDEHNLFEDFITYMAAAIGALSFAFSDTFWFNGAEAEVYATATFLMAFAVYMVMLWFEKADEEGSDRYLYFIAYLMGISTGVHLMALLAIPSVVMLIYYRKFIDDDAILKQTGWILLANGVVFLLVAMAIWSTYTNTSAPSPEQYHQTDKQFVLMFLGVTAVFIGIFFKKVRNKNSIYYPVALGGAGLVIVYPLIVKYVPKIIEVVGGDNTILDIILFALMFAVLYYGAMWAKKNNHDSLRVVSMSIMFALIGFTTYTMIIIRANEEPPINLNNPKTFGNLMSYLNRDQYGDAPIFRRRYSNEPMHARMYRKYSSDLDFFIHYQMDHMETRYWLFNYAGRHSTRQDDGVDWSQLWGIPFFFGLFGMFYHFKRDWKMASVYFALFMMLGYIMAIYFNSQEPQPRERDYFYVGAYFVFSIWIAIGTRGFIDMLKESFAKSKQYNLIATAGIVLAFVFIPANMLLTNYHSHDRSRNYLPWDYAYNLLQSCAPNAILFTNGDNDTFPLWYLQDVEGVRRDIRIANLSLLNTSWYIKQLKNQSPYGAMKVAMQMSNSEIDKIGPSRWQKTKFTIPVPKSEVKQLVMKDNAKIGAVTDSTFSKDLYAKFGITDTTNMVDKITWEMPSTLKFGDISAVRAQDLVVLDILKSFNWERPVYFSVTCSDDSRIGLDKYMKMEGLAYRFVPEKAASTLTFLNEPIMKADLFDSSNVFSKTYRPGLKFRGLNDPTVFFNSNQIRLVQNYRNSYIRLALYYLYDKKNNNLTIKTLNEMEKKLPRHIIAMDYRLMFDVSGIYKQAGAETEYLAMTKEIEKKAWKMLERNPRNLTSNYNPYRMLLEIYDNTGQYQKALKVVDKLGQVIPGDKTVDMLKKKYQALLKNSRQHN